MKVKLTCDVSVNGMTHGGGSVLDLPPDYAMALVEGKRAVAVKQKGSEISDPIIEEQADTKKSKKKG